MKSLEIVNNIIVKQQTIEVKGNDRLPSIFVDDIRIAGVKWNDSPDANYISAKLNTHSRVISMENLEQIKQDLEVLEIIKKNLFNKYAISTFDGYESGMENPIYYIELENYDKERTIFLLEEDEMNKLKQWLEENENDR